MPLSFRTRLVGDITVVHCDGRIVEGAESAALRQHVEDRLRYSPAIVLHLGGVQFIDSSGLGLLIRVLARTGHGNLKLCAVSSRIAEVLKMTRLSTVFDSYESEADAIAAFFAPVTASGAPSPLLSANILCVETAADTLTYVNELLRQAGFSVMAVANLSDAMILLKATTPKMVVVGSGLRATRDTGAAETFNGLLDALPVVELPLDFSRQDPIETGQALVERVRALMGAADTPATAAC